MAAKSVEIFSTGCLIETVISVRRADESDSEWNRITERCFNHPHYMSDPRNGDEGALRFGVALPDGQKATTAQSHPAMLDGTDPITGPVLIPAGGGGGSGSEDELVSSSKFWLWPLPLGGDVHFVAQWDDLGMKEGSVLVSGEQLKAAVADVQKYWAGPGPE
jgi:hypothetical protein